MTIREFFKYHEACGQLNDAEAIRQSIICKALPAYVELHDSSCTVHSRKGAFPAEGSNSFANWFSATFDDEPQAVVAGDGPLAGWFRREYILQGWFRVDPQSAINIARMEDGMVDRVRVIGEFGDGRSATFNPEEYVRLANLWFRVADIERVVAEPQPSVSDSDKSMDPRERITLLCIIGALAKNAQLDLSQPIKTGEAIAAMMPDVKLSGRTIGEHLKAVREAMDSRKG